MADARVVSTLRAARPYIESGRRTYICNALDLVAGDRAKDVIRERLKGRSTVAVWLHDVAGIPDSELTDDAMREYRLRWIDSLIAEFAEQEAQRG